MMTLSLEALHDSLTEKLSTGNYAKATDLNILFHACQSLEQLEKAKEVLARYVAKRSCDNFGYTRACF